LVSIWTAVRLLHVRNLVSYWEISSNACVFAGLGKGFVTMPLQTIRSWKNPASVSMLIFSAVADMQKLMPNDMNQW
jgi:hypothetical protein